MTHCPIEDRLTKEGMRVTQDRHAILELFQEARTWNAKEIQQQLRMQTLSTIYRNLEALEASGFLDRVLAPGAETRYEAAQQPHHDHVNCPSCKTLRCVPCPSTSLPPHQLFLATRCHLCV